MGSVVRILHFDVISNLRPTQMGVDQESGRRLAELIWRTVKLRVFLLIISIVILLVVWSALVHGNQEAQKLDFQFCNVLVNQDNEIHKSLNEQWAKSYPGKTVPFAILNPADFCSGLGSRKWIEISRSSDAAFPLNWPGLPDAVVGLRQQRQQGFADYDTRRYSTYQLTLTLSPEYTESRVEANALSIAEIVPIFILIALTVYFILGFQEQAYRDHLRGLLRTNVTEENEAELANAQTQFFASPQITPNHSFTRYFICSPEKIVTRTLFFTLLFLLAKVITVFIFSVVHLTDTIFSGYPFKLYFVISITVCILVSTRRYYPRAPVYAGLVGRIARCSLWLSGWWTATIGRRWPRLLNWSARIMAILGFLSLCLPWAWGVEDLLGFEFVLKQPVMHTNSGVSWYAISPTIFNEMRFQVWTALIFLLVCGLYPILQRRENLISRAGRYVRLFLACAVLFFSINFLIYLAILQYESMTPTPWADYGMFQNGPGRVGYSLISYDPAVGFWIFLGCCLVLVWVSLNSSLLGDRDV
jgi:hypothetical protein